MADLQSARRSAPRVPSGPSPVPCRDLFGPRQVPSESRYFINVTSHINFYRQRGVDTKAVLVVRDPALHFRGIQKTHCENETAAFEQYKVGRSILGYAMDHLDPDSLMVLSYETLMTLRGSYMQELFKFLNIKSNYYHEMRMETFVILP